MPVAFVRRDLVSDGDYLESYPSVCKEIWNKYKMRVIGFISSDPAAVFNVILAHPLKRRGVILVNSKDFDFTGEK